MLLTAVLVNNGSRGSGLGRRLIRKLCIFVPPYPTSFSISFKINSNSTQTGIKLCIPAKRNYSFLQSSSSESNSIESDLLMTQEAMASLMLIWTTQKMTSFTTKMIKMPVTQRKRTIFSLQVSKLQACWYHLLPRSRNVAARVTKAYTSISPPFIAFYWHFLGPRQVSESMSTIKTVNFITTIISAAEMKRPQAKHMPKPGVEFEFSLNKPSYCAICAMKVAWRSSLHSVAMWHSFFWLMPACLSSWKMVVKWTEMNLLFLTTENSSSRK